MIFVLTHEYLDKSAVHICGATDSHIIANTWFNANDENNVYSVPHLNGVPEIWSKGLTGWKKEKEQS